MPASSSSTRSTQPRARLADCRSMSAPRMRAASRTAVEAFTRRAALTRFCDDGRLEPDNNRAENSLRGIALGRRNWTFAGSGKGGERAAAIYTLIETVKSRALEHAPASVTPVKDLLPYGIALQEDCERSPCSWRLVGLQAFADARL